MPEGTHERKILVAEDEPLLAQIFADVLSQLPVRILRAGNGRDALEMARRELPDLILLDAVMPELDGFQVAWSLKAGPETSRIPIIFLTSRDRMDDKIRGLELGAEDYLVKPVHHEELLARVRNVLQRAAAREMAPPAGASLVAGRLEAMSLANLIQVLEVEQRTGVLTLTRGQEAGHIHFREGQMTHAVQGARRGEAAVFRLLRWAEGEFAFDAEPRPAPAVAEVRGPNRMLLVDGAQRGDRMDALLAELPGLPPRLRIAPPFDALLHARAPSPEMRQMFALVDGSRDLAQVVDESPLDDVATLEYVSRLYVAGLLGRRDDEKRAAPRVGLKAPIRYGALRSLLQADSFNIGGGGVFIRTRDPLALGEEVLLTFALPGIDRSFSLRGKVVWSAPSTTEHGVPPGMGIQFLDLDPEGRRTVEGFGQDRIVEQILGEPPDA